MALSEKLKLLISADVDGAVKGFEKVGKSAGRDLGKAEDKLDKLGARFTKMGAASLSMAGVMAAGLATTVGAASDLAEAMNVTELTFGDSADEVKAWGDTTADAIGQSKRAALEGAGAVGGLLQNVGFLQEDAAGLSMDLVTLSSDMASAFNTEPADALEAIRSGLAGQSEPLRRYNVFLSEAEIKNRALTDGIWDGTGAISENEKAQARLKIIMEQTDRVQGDFAATSEGAANAQRVFKANLEDTKAAIGEAVLPIFEDVLGVANDLFTGFNNLDAGTKELIGRVLVLGTGLAALFGVMSLGVGKAIKLRKAFQSLGKDGMSKASAASGILTLALVGGFAAWDNHNKKAAVAKEILLGFADAMGEVSDPVSGVVRELQNLAAEDTQLSDMFGDLGREGVRMLAHDLYETGVMSDELRQKFADQGVSLVAADLLFGELATAVEGAAAHIDDMGVIVGDAESQMEALRPLVGLVAGEYYDAEEAADGFGLAQSRIAPALDSAGGKWERIQSALEDVNDELATYFGIVKSETQLQLDWETSIDDVVAAQEENKLATDFVTKAGQANRQEGLRLLGVLEDVMQARFDETGSLEDAKTAGEEYVAQLEAELVATGASEEAVRAFILALGLVPSDVVASVDADTAQALIDLGEFEATLKRIAETPYRVDVEVIPPGAQLAPDGGGGLDADNFWGDADLGGDAQKQDTKFSSGAGFELTLSDDLSALGFELAEASKRVGGFDIEIRGN